MACGEACLQSVRSTSQDPTLAGLLSNTASLAAFSHARSPSLVAMLIVERSGSTLASHRRHHYARDVK